MGAEMTTLPAGHMVVALRGGRREGTRNTRSPKPGRLQPGIREGRRVRMAGGHLERWATLPEGGR